LYQSIVYTILGTRWAIFKMADITHLEIKGYVVIKTLKRTIPECLWCHIITGKWHLICPSMSPGTRDITFRTFSKWWKVAMLDL